MRPILYLLEVIPAVGQGILGIETRDEELDYLLMVSLVKSLCYNYKERAYMVKSTGLVYLLLPTR